ncbi:hypothetical protein Goari_022837 [Gossypium aridum]|uniref:Uncharacterized protein n=1 Tax=Gossypium aridum TaxID=34290 RepID=A0A7J8YRX5_GOSAI|nr:hypothetical protein [Gossypium aridum]
MKAHGCEIWDLASRNPDFSKLFNDGLACTSKVITSAILSGYKQGSIPLDHWLMSEVGQEV